MLVFVVSFDLLELSFKWRVYLFNNNHNKRIKPFHAVFSVRVHVVSQFNADEFCAWKMRNTEKAMSKLTIHAWLRFETHHDLFTIIHTFFSFLSRVGRCLLDMTNCEWSIFSVESFQQFAVRELRCECMSDVNEASLILQTKGAIEI